MTQWEVSGCHDAKARQPNGYFSPLACGVLPQLSRHGEQNTGDGEKRRAGKPANAVRQHVKRDAEANDNHQQPKRREPQSNVLTALKRCLASRSRRTRFQYSYVPVIFRLSCQRLSKCHFFSVNLPLNDRSWQNRLAASVLCKAL